VFLLELLFNRRASEKKKKKKKAFKKTVLLYNKLALLDPGSVDDLLSDLSLRTHLKIEKVEIRKIDLTNGTAELEILYRDKNSGEK
jgi:hypothetical protein